ncbi:unnamed protein product, partial [Mesorhabditis spiculigera]
MSMEPRFYTEPEPLGRGGFGEVWLLTDTQRKMVMKKALRTDDYAGYLRELRTLKELAHENVVRYYEPPENYPGIDQKEWLIFMEYCEHGSLKDGDLCIYDSCLVTTAAVVTTVAGGTDTVVPGGSTQPGFTGSTSPGSYSNLPSGAPVTGGICSDLSSLCGVWARNGFCTSSFYPEAVRRQQCGITCQFCGVQTTVAICKDKHTAGCPVWQKNGFCQSSFYNETIRREMCLKSCGYC